MSNNNNLNSNYDTSSDKLAYISSSTPTTMIINSNPIMNNIYNSSNSATQSNTSTPLHDQKLANSFMLDDNFIDKAL